MIKKEIKVKKQNNLIDEIYSNSNLSKDLINKLLRKKDIRVNYIRQKENIKVNKDDIITYYINDDVDKKNNFEIIFEDDNFAIIDKSYNIEVENAENSIIKILNSNKEKNNKQKTYYPVHRIDRNTTGLVIFAKNENYLNYLNNLFYNKEIEKKYLAIVIGNTNYTNYMPELYLFVDKKNSISIVKDIKEIGYTKIFQKINTIENFSYKDIQLSLIEITLISGKTHQIRSVMKFLNHPILGDGKYGDNRINKKLKFNYQLLNSYELKFDNFVFKSKNNPYKYFT